MDFNMKFLLVAMSLTLLNACSSRPHDYKGDDYNIGDKLSRISSLNTMAGEKKSHVAIYDETIKKIQVFDIQNNQHDSTIDSISPPPVISNPTAPASSQHYVLYAATGNYVVDITTKGYAIIKKDNTHVNNPITMMGNPTSAAFRDDLGLLVIYDDAGSVGVLRLNEQGDVIGAFVGGNKLSTTSSATIASGDLNDAGKLMVSLSNGDIASIDLEQTITQRKWVYATFNTTLKQAEWISHLPGENNKILIRISETRSHTLYLYDLPTETILSQVVVEGILQRSSRQIHPHVIISNQEEFTILYTDGVEIKKISQFQKHLSSLKTIVSSVLNLNTDTLSVIELDKHYDNENRDFIYLNTVKENRSFKQIRFSDLLLTTSFPLPNLTTIEISENKVISLYPNRLGYAVLTDIHGRALHEFKFFNRKYLKK